jgi:hypothetical protein
MPYDKLQQAACEQVRCSGLDISHHHVGHIVAKSNYSAAHVWNVALMDAEFNLTISNSYDHLAFALVSATALQCLCHGLSLFVHKVREDWEAERVRGMAHLEEMELLVDHELGGVKLGSAVVRSEEIGVGMWKAAGKTQCEGVERKNCWTDNKRHAQEHRRTEEESRP